MVYHFSLYTPDIVNDDLESLFSLDDEQSLNTLLIVDYSDSKQEYEVGENYEDPFISPPEINVVDTALSDLSFSLERSYAKINIFF